MARKPRIEIAGGLYRIIARGNNRKRIFRSADDYLKFLDLLKSRKAKYPFYLYAYCLMPNHVHLLGEMQDIPISRVMHSLLTAYSKYYNRRYRKVGHLLSKNRQLVMVKEAIIVIGLENGIRTRELAEMLGLDPSAVSKRREAARARAESSPEMKRLLEAIRSSEA